MKMELSVPKRRHVKFRLRGVSEKKEYNIQNRLTFEIKKYNSLFGPWTQSYVSGGE
jgi:hypothetical protein